MKILKSVLPYAALLLIVTGFVNFFWFLGESNNLGGDALNGYVKDGHYFVGSHGYYKEVSKGDWERSRIHGISVFVTHPLLMVSMGYMIFRFAFPTFTGKRFGKEGQERVQAVRSSGMEIASARCGGKIGSTNFNGFPLNVTVFPTGILVRPTLMPTAAILRLEVRSIEVKQKAPSGESIQINHLGRDTYSPLLLNLPSDSDLARAIERMTGMTFS